MIYADNSCDKEVYDEVKAEFAAHNVYFVKPNEVAKLEAVVMNEAKLRLIQNCWSSCSLKLLHGLELKCKRYQIYSLIDSVGPDYLSHEKLSPVFSNN